MKLLKKILLFCFLFFIALCIPCIKLKAKYVIINKSECKLEIGETVKLKLKNAKGKVKWSSSSKKIATVSKKGLVTAKKAGVVTITAKNDSKKYKCTVVIGEKDMPEGKWYDKNGSTMLEFKGNKMYATWWDGMTEPEEFNIKIEDTGYGTKHIINADGDMYAKGFGLMSMLEIMDDGTLTAYEEVLDAEGHSYKFVPEDKIEEERAIKDFSTDKPKTIKSKDIKSFSLYLHNYTPKDLSSGSYSMEIKKKDDGKFRFSFDGMGSSYVIVKYDCEVDSEYVDRIQKMIEEQNLAEHNGMFFSHDKNNTEYSLYVTYETGERLTLAVGIKALDKWPVDNEKFIEYALSIVPDEFKY